MTLKWKVTRTSPTGEPLEWRAKPWTIEKRRTEDPPLFGLWKDFRADPDCWTTNLEDAMALAITTGKR